MKTLHAIHGPLPTGLNPNDWYGVEISDARYADEPNILIFRTRLARTPNADWFDLRYQHGGWTESDLATVKDWPETYAGRYYTLSFTGAAIMAGQA